MKIYCYIFLLIFIPYFSFAQYIPIPITKVEETILKEVIEDTTLELIKNFNNNFSFGIGNYNTLYNPILIKSKNKNFILIDGTNRIYQCIKQKKTHNFDLIRIDSTTFYGDNFNMIPFYRKDTIFQYGGYGFWQNRDFFSYYRPIARDWEFYPNEEGLQNTYTLNYYDKLDDKFYIIGRYHQDSHKSPITEFKDSVYCFDFINRKWNNLGKIATSIFEPPVDKDAFWTNNKGVYFRKFNNLYLIDLSKNSIYSLKKEYNEKFVSFLSKISKSTIRNTMLGLKDSLMVISGLPNNYTITKFKLINDYFDYQNPLSIYIPIKNNTDESIIKNIPLKYYIVYIFLFITLSSSIFIYIKNKSKKTFINPNQKSSDIFLQIRYLYTHLNQIEKDLLNEIISASILGKKLDNNEINKIIGVQNKQPMIQKTRRSLTITKINDLYMNLTGSKSAIIKRSQDEQDKRSFNYFIITKDALEIADILKKINEQNI